jgi:hypothetical protein
MRKDIIVEINRIKEIMGLILEQEQTQGSWQTVAGGKPFDLLTANDNYFTSDKTRGYIEFFPKVDTKISFRNITKFRIPVSSLPEQTRNHLSNKNKFELSLIEEDFLYGNLETFGDLRLDLKIRQNNPEYNSKLAGLCYSLIIMGYIEKNINNDVKITLNNIRNLKLSTNTTINGTNYFGTTIPGLSDEILTKFMEFIDAWVRAETNPERPNYSVNTLSNKIKPKGIRLTPGRPEEVQSSEEPTEKTFNAFFSDFKISADQGSPFEDNKSDLTEVSLGIIKEIANNIQKVTAQNPVLKARVVSKVNVENSEKDIPFTIRTSASRLMNTNEAKDKTFSQLSQERAQRVYQTMQEMLGPLLVGGLPKPVMDFNGTNGDGSSGPNPPNGYSVTTDGRTSTSYKTGTPEANKERNKFGTPPAKIEDLNQYKYCIIQIAIEFFSEEESGGLSPGAEDEILVGVWTFDIVPGTRPKKPKKTRTRRIRINIPPPKQTTYGVFGRHELCDAYR